MKAANDLEVRSVLFIEIRYMYRCDWVTKLVESHR